MKSEKGKKSISLRITAGIQFSHAESPNKH